LINPLVLAGVEGLASALGERLIAAPGEAIGMKALVGQVRELRVAQERTDVTLSQLTAAFEEIVRKVDGLVVEQSRISFRATSQSPTLGDSLLCLDERISKLRSSVASTAALPSSADAYSVGQSIFDGLDEEIQNLRSANEDGQSQP
jgi:hypothetical protein